MYDPKLNSYIVSHILSTSHVHIMSQDTCFCIEETWKIRFSRAFKKNTNFAFCFGGTFSFWRKILVWRNEAKALPCLSFSCLSFSCLALPVPCHAFPGLALPCLSLPLPCVPLPCLALPCLDFTRLALSCLAFISLASPCLA